MNIQSKNLRKEQLNKELEASLAMAADLAQEIKDSSKNTSMNLQNFYDSASDERDIKNKIQLHEFSQKRIGSIRRNLQAIENGTYGRCQDCGCEVDERRLLVAPESTVCISCQSDREHKTNIEGQRFISTPGFQYVRVLPLVA